MSHCYENVIYDRFGTTVSLNNKLILYIREIFQWLFAANWQNKIH